MAYNFVIIYHKRSENVRADVLSRRKDYLRKPTERPYTILREGHEGIEYNYELLAIISVIEDKDLEQRIKDVYTKDEYTNRILKELIKEF